MMAGQQAPPTAQNETNETGIRTATGTGKLGNSADGPRPSTDDTAGIEKPWREMVLALDGGGIRGYSSLLILQRLMDKIKEIEDERNTETGIQPTRRTPLLPCHYFDFIVGTSTGGLIAIMLGRLRMSVSHCLEEFENFGELVFGRPRYSLPIRSANMRYWIPWNKYSHRNLEDAIKSVIRKHCPNQAHDVCDATDIRHRFPLKESGHLCKAAALAWKKNEPDADTLAIFRTYSLPREGDPLDVSIREVGRATTAAPRYFAFPKIKGCRYQDGGFGANNPSVNAWIEAVSMHKHTKGDDEPPIGLFLSIGTGKSTKWTRFGNLLSLIDAAKNVAVQVRTTNETMATLAQGVGVPYHRFTVDDGFDDIKLDTWDTKNNRRDKVTVQKMVDVTNTYLANVSGQIKECATALVDYRRARAATPEWAAFEGPDYSRAEIQPEANGIAAL